MRWLWRGVALALNLFFWPIRLFLRAMDCLATHVNVGGQGPWVARAIATLGGTPVLCAPFGGDTGRTARLLLDDSGFELSATTRSRVLVLSGMPLAEPVAHRGPFVMNSAVELEQAFADYREGRLAPSPRALESATPGRLAP